MFTSRKKDLLQNKEGIIWSILVILVVAIAAVSITTIQTSTLVSETVVENTSGAAVNATDLDVDITIVPADTVQ